MNSQSFGEIPAVSGYVFQGVVGRGGMGTVYRAVQLSHNRPVAIKVLAEALRDDPAYVARFKREAEVLAALEHPHIVPLIDSGEVGGVPFMVMRLIDGATLRQMTRLELLDPVDALQLLTGVARALDFAHSRGHVHKDVKPHNILVEHGDHAWLVDFGLTMLIDVDDRFTSASQIAGSFDYLAPEIADGQHPSPASDIYSLGVTAFQILTGKLPFPASNVAEKLSAHAHVPRPAASAYADGCPEEIDEPLRRAMAIDPADRPRSAVAMLEPLRAAYGLPPLERLSPGEVAVSGSGTDEPREAATGAATVVPQSHGAGARRTRRLRRFAPLGALAAIVAAGVVVALAALGGASTRFSVKRGVDGTRQTAPTRARYVEYAGGPSHTWSDDGTAAGKAGAVLQGHKKVEISCRARGFRVQDGNVWWYRIASKPWNGRYYVSADAFYNNGRRSGSLIHTPFYDPKVPVC